MGLIESCIAIKRDDKSSKNFVEGRIICPSIYPPLDSQLKQQQEQQLDPDF